MDVFLNKRFLALTVLAVVVASVPLLASSRLGRITGVMDEVVEINLGSRHGVTQGLRGLVFKFDDERKTIDVANIQVIGVSEDRCLARIIDLLDNLEVGQFVDIEGTLPQQPLERVDIVRVLEESARNYFAARQYTEPDSANCLAVCRRILERDPDNRLANQLISRMMQNYFQWAERERINGRFAGALVYYKRILRIDPVNEAAYEHIWDIIDMIDAEAEVELDPIQRGRPPDFYYAVAEQYYRSGQFVKSSEFFRFLLDNMVRTGDLAAREGIRRNDYMLSVLDSLRSIRKEMSRQAVLAEQQRQVEEEERRNRAEISRYYRVVSEDLFRKKDLEGALVYYLKLLDVYPDDSLALDRKEFISRANMAVIPAGEFSRGSNNREVNEVMTEFGFNSAIYRELPKRWVYLDSFYIDRTEVTNRQYKRFLESTGHSPPLGWKDGDYPAGQDNHPVVYVSWLDAREYARWIGKRLPTEEEWEKAARGQNGYQWPWGDQFQIERCNVNGSGYKGPIPVGSILAGANEFGVLDLAGNVWEWVSSDLLPYPGYDQDRFLFPQTLRKVIKGGSFKEGADQARGAFRGDGALDQIYNNVGFRCARDLRTAQETLE